MADEEAFDQCARFGAVGVGLRENDIRGLHHGGHVYDAY